MGLTSETERGEETCDSLQSAWKEKRKAHFPYLQPERQRIDTVHMLGPPPPKNPSK